MCIEEYIRNMVDLEVRPEVTFGVLGSFYQVELSFMKFWSLMKETPFPIEHYFKSGKCIPHLGISVLYGN